jgi:hypothetical protein
VLREGVLQGEGYGIITTKDGQRMTTWRGQGIGNFTSPGKVRFRGSMFFKIPSASEGGKLLSLNNIVGVNMANTILLDVQLSQKRLPKSSLSSHRTEQVSS